MKILKNWSIQKVIWTKYFIVTDSFKCSVTVYWEKYNILIPEWFLSDLGSIPSIFFFFDSSKYISYLFHDYTYSLIWDIVDDEWYSLVYDQETADNILDKWLELEWMLEFWRNLVRIWLFIWWRFNFQKRDRKLSEIKRELNL